MKEHIEQIAEEYVENFDYKIHEQNQKRITIADFTAGINRVLQHPEEFGLQAKEY